MALRTVAPRRVPPPPAALLGILILLAGLVPAPAASAAAATAPPGWQVVGSEILGPGVEHQTLRMASPAQEVHVARLSPGGAGRLLPVLADDVLTGPSSGQEPTSAMCARVKCVAAVNGDFFDGAGDPVGSMVSAGELVTSPATDHILLRVDAQGRATLRPGMDWSAGVTTADGRSVAVDAVNRPLTGDGIALYSRRWGPSTGTDPATTEVALQLPPAGGVLPTGATAVTAGPAAAGGNLPIGPGQVVVSGRGPGAQAVAQLASRAAVLNVGLGGTVTAIGGSPQLLSGGKVWFPTDNRDDFTRGRHARTMVGVTSNGEMLLVTADGAGPGSGLTLAEAAGLMSGLGAVDALNLDGGGSSTFVGTGTVRSHPSDGAERPVASALTVLTAPTGPTDLVAALLTQLTNAVNGLLAPPG